MGLEHIGESSLHLLAVGSSDQVTSLKRRFRAGDVLFGKLRPYFRKVVQPSFAGVCSTDIFVVRPRLGVDRQFLFYFMAQPSFVEEASRAAEGTKMPRAKWDYLEHLPLRLPTLPEQRAIAHTLGSLDDKIELNRRMNQTLEQIAQALFKSWFVDFDPVRAKSEGRWKKGESLPGVPSDMWDLWPRDFEQSEIGEVPMGWRNRTLGDVLEVIETGSRPSGGVGEYTEGVPSVGAENILGIGRYDFSKTRFVPIEFYEGMQRGRFESRDVLLYKDGGRPGEYEPHVSLLGDGFPYQRFCINEHVYRLRTKPPIGQAFLFLSLSSEAVMEEMRQRGTGVAVPGLNSTAVRSLSFLTPSPELSRAFESVTEPTVARILSNAKESVHLSHLRDALLPKLLSGEIRVPVGGGA